MHLLHLSLEKPNAISNCIYGNFSGPKVHEIVISRGNMLELVRPDENGKLNSIVCSPIFGIVRSMITFRLTGGSKDYIVVGSDSGKICILEYSPMVGFVAVHTETFGKTGCRRLTPGQYLGGDPKGRAIMIGGVEKQKMVYVMNRDASSRLTISSPLEAHRSHAIHFDIVGLDVGFENPIFASLEVDYNDADNNEVEAREVEKLLVFYELDLGLNHVTRRWSNVVPRSAHKLVALPGGADGPGGVLVCAMDQVVYMNENHENVVCGLPKRKYSNRDCMIISVACHRQRELFFILMQTDNGDILKATFQYNTQDAKVSHMAVRFFDTIPISNAFCITKLGFLFSASESGNHYLFQFQSLGDQTEGAIEVTSNNDPIHHKVEFGYKELQNIARVDEMESLAPITDLKVADYANENAPQIYALCGRAERSSMRILRHGLPVMEIAMSDLPGHPNAVWCIKDTVDAMHHKYIVVSFPNVTLVLAIGESVEEVTDSGLLGEVPTLLTALLQDNSIIQIHANGVRHIPKDRPVSEWKAPGKKVIEKCSANERQVVLSLAGGELVYFELEMSGSIGELVERTTTEIGVEIACVELGEVPHGRQRFPFLAVAGWDNTVRILSLDPSDLMRQRSTQALSSLAESLCIVEMATASVKNQTADVASTTGTIKGLFLNVGCVDGLLQRAEIDRITGALSDARTRFLGAGGVKLFRVKVQGENAFLALTSRAWLCYTYQSSVRLTPLSYDALQSASSFSSDQCSDGIVGVTSSSLRILSVDHLGDTFNQQTIPMQYTPRRFVHHPPSGKLIILESDHDALDPKALRAARKEQGYEIEKPIPMDTGDDDDEEDDEEAPIVVKGPVPTEVGSWGSQVRIFDPVSCATDLILEMEPNEAAVCVANCVFHDRGGETFVLLGIVKGMKLHAKKCSNSPGQESSIRVYRLLEGKQLVLVHSTPVDGTPYAMCSFQGRVVVSVGRVIRIYDLGKRKLLRKCENRNIPTVITKLESANDRIYASDLNDSFHMLKYQREDNQLVVFADDIVPRFVTSQVLLDYDTMAGGDKFGNVFVCRLPSEVSDDVLNPTGSQLLWDTGKLNGAPNKLEQIAQFYVGEVITGIVRTSFVPGGIEVLVYSTVMGTIGVLVPLSSREDVDFYTNLEMYMRQESPPLCGRDHLAYRSSFIPTKGVSDGTLCEQFSILPMDKQKLIASELDRSVSEISKKMEDIRNRLL